jgi:methyltransferase (TIGR00027 family)
MIERQPSRTAFAAAAHRATHQVLEAGAVFADPLALTILGPDAETMVLETEDDPGRRAMRVFIAARSNLAETWLAQGVAERAVTQVVVLGAGLDTFAYRHPLARSLKVFEVDHPDTQAWKRRRLAEAAVAAPETLTFAPVDFERDQLLDGLVAAGFDPEMRSFFVWLGVVPYLTETAIRTTLATIAGLPGGAEVVFDYADPPHTLAPEQQARHAVRAERVAAIGEPWLSYFDAGDLRALLLDRGFTAVEDLGPPELAERYWPGAVDLAPRRGGHVVFART